MSQQKPGKRSEQANYTPTYLEAPEDVRQAVQSFREKPASNGLLAGPAIREDNPADDAVPYRPQIRPPTTLLGILDDGSKEDGEWIRIRSDRIVLGRTEGDVRIPHDGLVSSKHAELVRERTAQGYRWVLVDLNSTNGTFIRVSKTELRHKNEIIIGRGRYRYENPVNSEPTVDVPGSPQVRGTVNWQGDPVSNLMPSLLEILKGKDVGQRFHLNEPEFWIGRDPQVCKILRHNDNFVSPRHAKLTRDSKAVWHIETNKALNGVWLKVDRIQIPNSCQFQLGEQRFYLKVQP